MLLGCALRVYLWGLLNFVAFVGFVWWFCFGVLQMVVFGILRVFAAGNEFACALYWLLLVDR